MPSVTPHFTVAEFNCHDGSPYPAKWVSDRLKPLCDALEVIREACGGASVTILSGYRSPAHNAEVGGASASQHMVGRAADISVNGYDARDVHAIVLRLHDEGKIDIGGLGSYAGWVHVDVRDNEDGRLRRWRL